MDTVFDSLLAAAQLSDANFAAQGANEPAQEYLTRLVQAIGVTPKEIWDSIPVAAQEWFNLAAGAINANEPCPDCPGYPGGNDTGTTGMAPQPQEPVAPADESNGQPAPTPVTETVVEPVAPVAAQPTVAEVKAPAAAKTKHAHSGYMMRARVLTLLTKGITTKDLLAEMQAEGFTEAKQGTIFTCREEVHNVLRAIKNVGYKVVNSNGTEVL